MAGRNERVKETLWMSGEQRDDEVLRGKSVR